MVEQSSGTYIINKDYDIVAFNQTAIDLYPSLKKGEKCYKCLMNLDAPCPPCPVANNIKGPKTYFDPIRKIYETVDAVPILAEDGTENHALVFSTVGEKERYSRQLPNTESEFNALYDQEFYDKLTGGLSEKGFIRDTEKVLNASKPEDKFVIAYFNIQNFKSINDIFGFQAGDTLLCEAYLSIEQTMRPLVLARLNGDLFICLYSQQDFDPELLANHSTKTWSCNGKNLPIHFLLGIYYVEEKSMSVSSMIDRARMASKSIVDAYVKPYAIFDDDMRKEYIDQAQILFDYEQGIEQQEVQVYYQPIVSAATQEIIAAEALVRWYHHERGYIRPDILVSVLEKNGHITKLDHYMLERVATKLSERVRQHKSIVPVAVNLSWMDLYDENMRNDILEKINHFSIPKGYLRFETTETAFNTMEDLCKEYIEQIRSSGAQIALDDFGSGYSYFSMMQSIQFDIVKIDMEFVKKIESSPDARNIICAIIAMCHEMNISVVAEGVETQAEYEFLQIHGCDYIQGYYFAKPMPEKEFYQFLETGKGCFAKKEAYFKPFVNEDEKKEAVDAAANEPEILEAILDRTGYFIQVCNPDTMEMIYANQATRMISGKPNENYAGQKCHKYMMNSDEVCAHCPLRLMRGENQRQLEVDDGNCIFSLTAQYFEWNGTRYFMEMGRDVSEQKKAERKYDSQILAILQSMPEQQGVFHMNVTLDECISSSGNAKTARDLQNMQSIDMLIRQISLFVPDEAGQKKFFETFCRDALLKAHEAGKREISLDTESYYDDNSIRRSRITVHLLENPKTKQLEAVLHGTDISKENRDAKDQPSKQELNDIMEKYYQADYERRIDFLTRLNNRKDLFDYLQKALTEKLKCPVAMFMIDVDNFKAYNDTHGHVKGDECLQRIAHALKAYGKEHDITFFRYGGEEILGVLEASKEPASLLAQGITEVVRNLHIERADEYGDIVTVSVGYTTNNSRYEKMIDKADQAMYTAKFLGKNQVVCFEACNAEK